EEIDRTADRSAKVVISEWSFFCLSVRVHPKRPVLISEVGVCIKSVISDELEQRSVKFVRTAAGNDVHLTAAAAARFRGKKRPKDLEFTDRVDAWVCLDRYIRPAVGNVRAVDRIGVLAGPR